MPTCGARQRSRPRSSNDSAPAQSASQNEATYRTHPASAHSTEAGWAHSRLHRPDSSPLPRPATLNDRCANSGLPEGSHHQEPHLPSAAHPTGIGPGPASPIRPVAVGAPVAAVISGATGAATQVIVLLDSTTAGTRLSRRSGYRAGWPLARQGCTPYADRPPGRLRYKHPATSRCTWYQVRRR
jgi:hypothetical protein